MIDEIAGRNEAVKRGIQTTGTLGILLAASKAGILDGEEAFHRLLTGTTFRASNQVRAEFAARFAKLGKARKKDSVE